jgi:hypothetical protein
MTDKTAVCVFPWELDILALVHGQEIEEVTIDELCDMKQGAIKVEKIKLKHWTEQAGARPARAARGMATSTPTRIRPTTRRRVRPPGEKYGMDKDVPDAVRRRASTANSAPAPSRRSSRSTPRTAPRSRSLKAMDEGRDRSPCRT